MALKLCKVNLRH